MTTRVKDSSSSSDAYAPFRVLEQELRDLAALSWADARENHRRREYVVAATARASAHEIDADKLAACLAALPTLWTDAEYNALAKECKRLEDDREYNAALVEQRDEEIQLLRTRLAALPEQRKSNRATDVLGWMDSEGPLTVAPGIPITALGSPSEAWQPMETAPKDGTWIIVHAPSREGLTALTCPCAWHPDAGFCVDEIREPEWWMPFNALPAPPARPADTRKDE